MFCFHLYHNSIKMSLKVLSSNMDMFIFHMRFFLRIVWCEYVRRTTTARWSEKTAMIVSAPGLGFLVCPFYVYIYPINSSGTIVRVMSVMGFLDDWSHASCRASPVIFKNNAITQLKSPANIISLGPVWSRYASSLVKKFLSFLSLFGPRWSVNIYCPSVFKNSSYPKAWR